MTYEGTVTEIIFRNEDNGYTVGTLKLPTEERTFVGSFVALTEGDAIVIEGQEKLHPVYGAQIDVKQYRLAELNTDKSIFQYLAAGNIDEIGPKMAERIVSRFGDQALTILESEPERLLEIEGIGTKKLNRIVASYHQKSAQRSIVIALSVYDIPASLAMRIYRTFGEQTLAVLHENPYLIAARVRGVGFLKADEIAMKMGIPKDAPMRVAEGIKYLLSEAGTNGNTYVLAPQLKERAQQLLSCAVDRVEEALYELAIGKDIVLDTRPSGEERIALRHIAECEERIAYRLLKLRVTDGIAPADIDIERQIDAAQARIGKTLEQKQREAVLCALEHKVMVLTGGPGTGKTTIISFIISCFEERGKKVKLCAPTGRAAKRMSEATGKPAMTIHRLLEVGYTGEEDESVYSRDEDNPIDADVIIVDEASMIDLFLMRALLEAIPSRASLIIVGDKDQLPSVGIGRVLEDIIESGAVPTAELVEIFRQSKESTIIVNAHRVNKGEALEIPKGCKDFFFMQRDDVTEAQALVTELVSERLPKYFGVEPTDIQVLCPIKKTAAGVHELNTQLQQTLNPKGNGKEFKHQDRILRAGDKIMQIKNNYEKEYMGIHGTESGKGVFNGDIGYIERVDPVVKEFFVRWEDQRRSKYGFDEADNIEHAYAMTVHKSQGSEFDIIVLPIVSLPPMMRSRNILYTALTRAKTAVVLVGAPYQVQAMIDQNIKQQRNSALADRLRRMKPLVLVKEE